RNGKYLYFLASTDAAPSTGWLDMSSLNPRVTASAYVVVLSKDLPSPLAPESDEEKTEAASTQPPAGADAPRPADKEKEAKPAAEPEPKKKDALPAVKIDLENIDQRILALPIPARHYVGLKEGKSGVLFLVESEQIPRAGLPAPLTLHKFDLEKRKVDKFLDGISAP